MYRKHQHPGNAPSNTVTQGQLLIPTSCAHACACTRGPDITGVLSRSYIPRPKGQFLKPERGKQVVEKGPASYT